MEVLGYDGFGVAVRRLRGVSVAAVVGRQHAVAGVGEGDEDVAELVGCFREAVDEEDGAFGLWGGGGEAFGVEDAEFGVGVLEPGLAVVWFGGGGGWHVCSIEWPRLLCQGGWGPVHVFVGMGQLRNPNWKAWGSLEIQIREHDAPWTLLQRHSSVTPAASPNIRHRRSSRSTAWGRSLPEKRQGNASI